MSMFSLMLIDFPWMFVSIKVNYTKARYILISHRSTVCDVKVFLYERWKMCPFFDPYLKGKYKRIPSVTAMPRMSV